MGIMYFYKIFMNLTIKVRSCFERDFKLQWLKMKILKLKKNVI